MIKLLIGGSPCTHWSIAQKNNRETTAEGIGWELFRNYAEFAMQKFKPDFFLYENNKSAAEPIKSQIRETFGVTDSSLFNVDNGVRFTYINSSLVSAQNRQRFYVTNWGDIQQPADRGILLKNILETGDIDNEKAYCLKHQAGNARDHFKKHHTNIAFEPIVSNAEHTAKKNVRTLVVEAAGKTQKPIYEVKNGLITIKDKKYPIKLPDGFYIIRKLTVKECCRLQTMPDDYCRAVSASQGYRGLGNGWTAEVIIELFKQNKALMAAPKDEKIVVLSMYDGIGTGRYVLDQLGFTNVEYHAYEIDKYAIQIAMSNYPDIIQHGDAFAVRDENWTI